GEYLALTRVWSMGSTVVLNLDMRVQVIEGDPRMTDSYGRVALQRGPLVYCLESPDNPTLQLRDIGLVPEPDLSAAWEPDLLNGVVAITGNGFVETQPDNTPAYRPVGSAVSRKTNVPIKAIPYYAWANRGRSDMTVWLRHQ
ncbi:MAG: glycoside hydrolase family 127 protein, partial [Armatimonadota bacterium]